MHLSAGAWVLVGLTIGAIVAFAVGAGIVGAVLVILVLMGLVTTLGGPATTGRVPTDWLGKADLGDYAAKEYEREHGYRS